MDIGGKIRRRLWAWACCWITVLAFSSPNGVAQVICTDNGLADCRFLFGMSPGTYSNGEGDGTQMVLAGSRFWIYATGVATELYRYTVNGVPHFGLPQPALGYTPSVYFLADGVTNLSTSLYWDAPATANIKGQWAFIPKYFIPAGTPCGPEPDYAYTPVRYRTYKLSIEEVGFTGDYPITAWSSPNRTYEIDSPDGTDPLWTAAGGASYVAVYKRNDYPKVFGKFKLTPPLTNSAWPLQYRVKRGSTVITSTNYIHLGGTYTSFSNLTLSNTLATLGAASFSLKWEVSADGGTTWLSAGSSGHPIYFLHDVPISPSFYDSMQSGTFPRLYDYAVEKVVYYAGGLSTHQSIAAAVASGIANDTYYSPGGGIAAGAHPLACYTFATGMCADLAALAQGLLRTAGVPGSVAFSWGGANAGIRTTFATANVPGQVLCTARYTRTATDAAKANPHFMYHAAVRTSVATLYDPSYGDSYNNWNVTEVAPGAALHEAGTLPQPLNHSGHFCPHPNL